MEAEQIVNVRGLVRPHFEQQWSRKAGAQLGRFDSSTGAVSVQPQDPREQTLVRHALGVIKGVLGARMDAGETIFVQRALVFVDGVPFATLVPPLKAREFIPTTVKGNPGDTVYLWRRMTRTGVARLFAPGAALDLPRANVYQEEISQRYYPVGVKIVYNYFELLAVGAALANGQPVDLVGESLRAALEALEKKLDLIAAYGTAAPPGSGAAAMGLEVEADVGITGLLNLSNATAYTIPVGAAGSALWSQKTPDEVLADLNGIVGGQVSATYEVHRPDTVIVPVAQFEQQLQRRMSDVSGETIGSFFLRTRREMGHKIEIHPWYYASGAGAGSTDVIAAYKRDPRMLEHVLAMDASPLPANTQGLETTQPVIAKTAGVVCHYPLSVSLGVGI